MDSLSQEKLFYLPNLPFAILVYYTAWPTPSSEMSAVSLSVFPCPFFPEGLYFIILPADTDTAFAAGFLHVRIRFTDISPMVYGLLFPRNKGF